MAGDVVVARCAQTHYRADSREEFRAGLAEAAAAAKGDVVLDLSGVVLLSSVAVRAIREHHQILAEAGRRIVAAGGGDLVRGVLKFAPFLHHHDSVEGAISALGKERT